MESQYSEYFEPELKELNNQAKETDKLYNETHRALDKNLERMETRQMMGSSSPYRDISELSKSLTSIRQTSVSISHEKINLKKTIIELDLKSKQTSNDSKNANTNEMLMRDLLTQVGRKQDINKATDSDVAGSNKGMDMLNNLDEKKLGINDNDLKMIDRFKGNCK